MGLFSPVVVISWPPRTPPTWYPSKTSGFRLALAAYMADVYPAGPEPMITKFSTAARTSKVQVRSAGCTRDKKQLWTLHATCLCLYLHHCLGSSWFCVFSYDASAGHPCVAIAGLAGADGRANAGL